MKSLKSLVAVLLSMTVILCMFTVSANAAAPTAKSIVAKALKEMQNATSISFSYDSVANYAKDRDTEYWTGICQSSNTMDFCIWINTAQPQKAWTEYQYGEKVYRKAYNSSSYTAYTDSDYIEERGTSKKSLEYAMSHMKNLKIASTSQKYYTITGTPNWNDTGVKKITLTISISSGRLVRYTTTRAKKTYTYFDSTDTYTITGGSSKFSNICYGDMALSLPDELKGK